MMEYEEKEGFARATPVRFGKTIVRTVRAEKTYSGLSVNDIEYLIEIVSKIHNINGASDRLILTLLVQLEDLLDIKGSALGIYYPASHENHFMAITLDMERLPTFGSYPCALNGNFSSHTAKGASTFFFNSDCGELYTYLCVGLGITKLNERQRQIINFALPYLFASMKKLHLISRRLMELGLTAREQEVMQWIIEGKDNWSISKILNVSERTIKFHNCNIYKKLGVSAKAEMICMYHKLTSSLVKPGADCPTLDMTKA